MSEHQDGAEAVARELVEAVPSENYGGERGVVRFSDLGGSGLEGVDDPSLSSAHRRRGLVSIRNSSNRGSPRSERLQIDPATVALGDDARAQKRTGSSASGGPGWKRSSPVAADSIAGGTRRGRTGRGGPWPRPE
jgi:hypothetical protein